MDCTLATEFGWLRLLVGNRVRCRVLDRRKLVSTAVGDQREFREVAMCTCVDWAELEWGLGR